MRIVLPELSARGAGLRCQDVHLDGKGHRPVPAVAARRWMLAVATAAITTSTLAASCTANAALVPAPTARWTAYHLRSDHRPN